MFAVTFESFARDDQDLGRDWHGAPIDWRASGGTYRLAYFGVQLGPLRLRDLVAAASGQQQQLEERPIRIARSSGCTPERRDFHLVQHALARTDLRAAEDPTGFQRSDRRHVQQIVKHSPLE